MKIGQKLVCVDISGNIKNLHKFNIYTISNYIKDKSNIDGIIEQVELYEVRNYYYNLKRFLTINEYRKIKLEKISFYRNQKNTTN